MNNEVFLCQKLISNKLVNKLGIISCNYCAIIMWNLQFGIIVWIKLAANLEIWLLILLSLYNGVIQVGKKNGAKQKNDNSVFDLINGEVLPNAILSNGYVKIQYRT